jgi:hypothetical protein
MMGMIQNEPLLVMEVLSSWLLGSMALGLTNK